MRLLPCLAPLLMLAFSPLASAEDKPREFLRALWAKNLSEQALDYIDRLQARDGTPVELHAELEYLRGLTHLAASRQAGLTLDARNAAIEDARHKIQTFVAAHPQHPRALEARQELVNVAVEAARLLAASSERQSERPATEKLLVKSRDNYAQAEAELDDLQQRIREKLEQMPRAIPPANRAALAERDELRRRYVELQMMAAVCRMESAKTHIDLKKRNEGLKEAADAWEEIYEKYRRRVAGLYSLLNAATCYVDMEDYRSAEELLQELIEQPADPGPFRALRTKTLVQLAKCCLATGKAQGLIAAAQPWLDQQRPEEKRHDEWLSLQLAVARAYQQVAPDDAEKRADYLAKATDLAREVIAAGGEHREAAARLLAELDPEKPAPMPEDPISFAEAVRKRRKALEQVQSARLLIDLLRTRLESETSTRQRAELESRMEEAQTESLDALTDAARNFERGLALLPKDANAKEEGQARYYLAYVYHQQQRYTQAITLAMPILDRSPGEPSALPAAKIVLASRIALWNGADNASQRSQQAAAIVALDEFVRQTWPHDELARKTADAAKRLKGAIDSENLEP